MKKFLVLFSFFALAAERAFALDLTNITAATQPGNAGGDLANWVQSFYLFSLVGGVFLAVGVIVWAGIRYSLAAGNPSTQSDARDQILQALLGLLLLFGAYLVLNTINPTLTNLAPPTLNSVSAPGVQVAPGSGPADITLSPEIQAEMDPSLSVKFAKTYNHDLSMIENRNMIKSACDQATAGSGYIVNKTIPGSSDIVYMCVMRK